MRRVSVALLTLVVALLLPARALAHEGHEHKVMGTVKAVDAKHIEVAAKDGTTDSIMLKEDTKCFRGKSAVTPAEIKVGDRVVVTFIEKGGDKLAQEVLLGRGVK